LHLIAPFFDLSIIKALVSQLQPKRLVIGVDVQKPNLDGFDLLNRCHEWNCELVIKALDGSDVRRPLHAKTIIGSGPNGVWYVSGSANITKPAWSSAWSNGGNLELVVWDDSSQESADVPPLRIVELGYQPDLLSGRFVWSERLSAIMQENNTRVTQPNERSWALEFLRNRDNKVAIQPDSTGRFSIHLPDGLAHSEAGRIVTWSDKTSPQWSPYHWIDQLVELTRFGHRTYHTRVKENMQTFAGAGKVFEELLNFLWNRVDPQTIHRERDENPELYGRSRRRDRQKGDIGNDDTPAPPPEDFIIDEVLVDAITWRIDEYLPHDQSTLSLRDLLSLALLRLTVETEPSSIETGDPGERDEDADTARTEEQNKKRKEVLINLRDYLCRYCKKYGQRLLVPEFVTKIGPTLLFENHYTLGRILLEFADKAEDQFTANDLRQAVLNSLGGLFWPSAVGLTGPSAWETLIEAGHDEATLRNQWTAAKMPALIAALITEAWGGPPGWQRGLYDESLVRHYLLVQALIHKMEHHVGEKYWHISTNESFDMQDLWGFRRVSDVTNGKQSAHSFAEIATQFDRCLVYLVAS
jgi:hypothetical protein